LVILFPFRIEKVSRKDLFLVITGFFGILLMTWNNVYLGVYLLGDLEALIAAFLYPYMGF